MSLSLIVIAVALLVCCWIWGKLRVITKCILTILYAATWGLAYIPFHGLYLFPLSQAAAAILFGGLAFGIDWLMKDVFK